MGVGWGQGVALGSTPGWMEEQPNLKGEEGGREFHGRRKSTFSVFPVRPSLGHCFGLPKTRVANKIVSHSGFFWCGLGTIVSSLLKDSRHNKCKSTSRRWAFLTARR